MSEELEMPTINAMVKEGDVYVQISPEGSSRQLTSSGRDRDATVSPNGDLVAFVRSTPDHLVETATGESEATEIWTIRVDGTDARKRVEGTPWATPETSLSGLRNPQFSPDGRLVYFLSMAWVTSAAIHVLDLETGKERFLSAGNTLEVIPKGVYAGHLIVDQHRYFLGGGSYDWFWLIAPDGQVLGPIGPNDDSFRESFVSKEEAPVPETRA